MKLFYLKRNVKGVALFLLLITTLQVHAQHEFLPKEEWPQRNIITDKKISPASIDSLKKQNAFWYADKAFSEKEKNEKKRFEQQPWVKTIFWIIIIGSFLAFLITYLIKSNIHIFSKRNVTAMADANGEMPTNLFTLDYEQAIQNALHLKDYRSVTRLMYLQSLKTLTEKKLIVYKPEKTNFEYLTALHDTKIYASFFAITRNYEFAWYGKFDISDVVFQKIQQDFSTFKNEIRQLS